MFRKSDAPYNCDPIDVHYENRQEISRNRCDFWEQFDTIPLQIHTCKGISLWWVDGILDCLCSVMYYLCLLDKYLLGQNVMLFDIRPLHSDHNKGIEDFQDKNGNWHINFLPSFGRDCYIVINLWKLNYLKPIKRLLLHILSISGLLNFQYPLLLGLSCTAIISYR